MAEIIKNYSELEVEATVGAEAYEGLPNFRKGPDLEGFKLTKFIDMRKEKKSIDLILFGSNQTNIRVNGNGLPLDEFIRRLPDFIGKSWAEIKNMPRTSSNI